MDSRTQQTQEIFVISETCVVLGMSEALMDSRTQQTLGTLET